MRFGMLDERTARKIRHVGSRGGLEGNFKIGVRSKRIRFTQRRDQ